MRATARKAGSHQIALIERELAELGKECARVVTLLGRLAKVKADGRDPSEILGELQAIVLHLHVHTKGLDDLIDELAPD